MRSRLWWTIVLGVLIGLVIATITTHSASTTLHTCSVHLPAAKAALARCGFTP